MAFPVLLLICSVTMCVYCSFAYLQGRVNEILLAKLGKDEWKGDLITILMDFDIQVQIAVQHPKIVLYSYLPEICK